MKYKISDLAKLLNVSTNTVRRYEDKGYIHAVRDTHSGYRYYGEEDIFGIMNTRLLRKYGFSHEELDGMRKFGIGQTIEAYEKRVQAMDEQIAYMTYVQHRIKDDLLLLKKAEQPGAVYEKDCVEQVYVLYQSGECLLKEPGRLEKIQEFLYHSPEVQHIYIIRKEDFDRGQFTINIGWAVKDIHMEKYHMTENEYTERYVQRKSVMGISRIPFVREAVSNLSTEQLKEMFMGEHLRYIREHGLSVSGDIVGIVITRAVEDGSELLYLLVSVPVA